MATGIRQSSCVNEYVKAACDLIKRWEELGADWKRAQILVNSAHTQLNKYSIPVAVYGWSPLTTALGLFSYQLWMVELVNGKWKLGIPKGKEENFKRGVAKLADTIYHEYRHCEQWFRMARWLGSSNWTAANITEKMLIPTDIAQAAVRLGQLSPEERNEASAWYESVYARPAEQKKTSSGTGFGNLNARDVVLGPGQLKPTKNANPLTAEISSMRQAAQYQQYRDLPEEDDAHAVGREVQEAIYREMHLSGAYEAPQHVNVSSRAN